MSVLIHAEVGQRLTGDTVAPPAGTVIQYHAAITGGEWVVLHGDRVVNLNGDIQSWDDFRPNGYIVRYLPD